MASSVNTPWPYPRYQTYRKVIQRAAAAWFVAKGFRTSSTYPYCLAHRGDWRQNIILPEVAQYIADEQAARERRRESFPLHKWVHHGLSSQTMLFNLVGPLILAGDLEPLKKAFEGQGIPWPAAARARIEVDDREVFNEDRRRPTSIDLGIEGDGPGLYVEAKLVEQEFGGCSVFKDGDCDGRNPAADPGLCYLHHIARRYWSRLQEFGFLSGPMAQGPVCVLATYYQFFREVLFALAKGGHFILLADARNPVFGCDGQSQDCPRRGLMPFLLTLVPEHLRGRVGMVSIQDVVREIKASRRHDHWIGEFESKYGMKGEP